MKKIILYKHDTPDLFISISVLINQDGDLEISGYDVNRTAGGVSEDADYEYSATVEKIQLPALRAIFNVSTDLNLLNALASRFNDNYCFSNLLKFLKENNIAYTDYYWR